MSNTNSAVDVFNERTQMNKQLEGVLVDIRVQLQEEQALTKDMNVLNDKIDELVEELFAKQDQRDQLRTHIQKELASALYPIIEYDLRDSLLLKSGSGSVRDMQVINEVLNERCEKYLASLTQQRDTI